MRSPGEPKFKNGYANASDCFWASDDAGSMVVRIRENSTPEQYLANGRAEDLAITIRQHSGLLTEAGGKACEIAQAVMQVIEPKLS